jgi:hypothetical protein
LESSVIAWSHWPGSQNADSYKQLGALNPAGKVEEVKPENLAKHTQARLLAGFMNNTTAQVFMAILAAGICYGLFEMLASTSHMPRIS